MPSLDEVQVLEPTLRYLLRLDRVPWTSSVTVSCLTSRWYSLGLKRTVQMGPVPAVRRTVQGRLQRRSLGIYIRLLEHRVVQVSKRILVIDGPVDRLDTSLCLLNATCNSPVACLDRAVLEGVSASTLVMLHRAESGILR